ncbi:nuclease-related domain-containing DEAD/DEAH box helicase [Nocardioides sp. Kera G14]|uniref:nuclease-related domain-containing DEAD/DEAH box helicase n=1 Tax=Nocardioides sp. Kera G14 TaxID=2884264 RepID=UPI001D102AE6|nr:UvrD-helicase domain-containing protein [Nocardioides sp. Kera G14]UDY24160.1 UvrD-helicase domain-containing protein [Nocardioides sp. Kera G14]
MRERERALHFEKGADYEQRLAVVLRTLEVDGWMVLEDRRWPGSKRANVDFILIGPPGVVVIDAKSWEEVYVERGVLFRGEEDETDTIESLDTLAGQIVESVGPCGLTRASISVVLAFDNRRFGPFPVGHATAIGDAGLITWLQQQRRRLTADKIREIGKLVEEACPEFEPTEENRRRRPHPRLRGSEPEALIDVEALTAALLERELAGPIEDWMTFLHPDQNKVVRAHWTGPARIGGPAGTGKTSVGLHRAVYLAERSKDPILFVSFVRTLPVVLGSLARRLSPTAADNIEFTGIHRLAHTILREAGRSDEIRLDPYRARRAFDKAWRETPSVAALRSIDERKQYWAEEVDYVIKGRGLIDFSAYKELDRIGRKTRLTTEQRGHAWDLYIAYQANLDAANVHDFNDLLILAHEAVQDAPDLFTFGGVVIDEVQDLNLVGLHLLTALAPDRPNGLLLIGDGQQAVYPGGFRLTEAGISVKGRASVLRVNYRNTKEILDTAASAVAGDMFDDLEDNPISGDRAPEVVRHGYPPLIVTERSRTALEAKVLTQIRATHERLDVAWGDMAVLFLRSKDADDWAKDLARKGVPVVDLEKYDGTTTDQLKVGTIKRAKGLEFKYVLMPELEPGLPDIWSGETAAAYQERCERLRRELFVGMTRARDGLWLGYLDRPTNTSPSRF